MTGGRSVLPEEFHRRRESRTRDLTGLGRGVTLRFISSRRVGGSDLVDGLIPYSVLLPKYCDLNPLQTIHGFRVRRSDIYHEFYHK